MAESLSAAFFQNNPDLRGQILTGVERTGQELGRGSYGTVEVVRYQGSEYAGKEIHHLLLQPQDENVDQLARQYSRECRLMCELRHPNIITFIGICFLGNSRLPWLVMEKLDRSVDAFLRGEPNLPLPIKRSIMKDIASGLVYLHGRNPAVIHRDLTANNVLLTSERRAKISDVGNSRIFDLLGQTTGTFTSVPGTLAYMPPEAQSCEPHYGCPLDIFSFGHLALYIATQTLPVRLLAATYTVNGSLRARSEVDRRKEYVTLMETRISPDLADIVKMCLRNEPHRRPHASEILEVFNGRLRPNVDILVPLTIPLQLNWSRSQDMPRVMECYIQSVVVQGTVYVGGGLSFRNDDNNNVVMSFDTSREEWEELPRYITNGFAMVVVNNQLVLVGGSEPKHRSTSVGVWSTTSRTWQHPYPPMSERRTRCSAAVCDQWLVVAGGKGDGVETLSSVEVLNLRDPTRWVAGPPLIVPWCDMKTAVLGNLCYFMGGCVGARDSRATQSVYSMSFTALNSLLNSQPSPRQVWEEISCLQTERSTPLCIRGTLLAVGGKDGQSRKSVSTIVACDRGVNWTRAGALQTPRWDCACSMIGEGSIFVAGGHGDKKLKSTDIGQI